MNVTCERSKQGFSFLNANVQQARRQAKPCLAEQGTIGERQRPDEGWNVDWGDWLHRATYRRWRTIGCWSEVKLGPIHGDLLMVYDCEFCDCE